MFDANVVLRIKHLFNVLVATVIIPESVAQHLIQDSWKKIYHIQNNTRARLNLTKNIHPSHMKTSTPLEVRFFLTSVSPPLETTPTVTLAWRSLPPEFSNNEMLGQRNTTLENELNAFPLETQAFAKG